MGEITESFRRAIEEDGAARERIQRYVYQLENRCGELRAERVDVACALSMLLERYLRLANSGDCGNWDPETEPEVILARKVLKAAHE